MAVTEPWTPSSWRSLPALQQPEWPDPAAVEAVRERLGQLPPLVFAGEARALQRSLGEAVEGRAFLLQAGDCAESFRNVSAVAIRERLKVLLQMSAVLTYGATLPVVKVGRIAGQFTKPRSSLTETVDGIEIPSFRGHAIHSDEPTPEARVPDPERMVQAYYQAVSTLNLLRAFTKGGFADLTQVHTWNQEFVASSLEGRRYETIANEIGRALRFMQAIGIDLGDEHSIHEVDIWTSHEALLLDYEEPLVRAVRESGVPVLWVCDPMHANTFVTPSGHKTRRFDDVLHEIEGFFEVHREVGTWPGGVHLEVTGEPDGGARCGLESSPRQPADPGDQHPQVCPLVLHAHVRVLLLDDRDDRPRERRRVQHRTHPVADVTGHAHSSSPTPTKIRSPSRRTG